MTDQSTHDQWTSPARTPYQASPDWIDTHPAEDGTADASAVPESAVAEPAVAAQRVDGSAVSEPGTVEAAAGHAAGEDTGVDTVDASVAAGRNPEHSAGVVPQPTAEPQADIIDRDEVNSPDVAAPADGPNGGYGIEAHPGDAATTVREPQAAEQRDSVAAVTDTSSPVDDVEQRADVTGPQGPIVATPAADATALRVTGSGELLPGDVPQEPVLALLDSETTDRFRDRWQQLQLRFIDDPHAVAVQAGALADDVVAALHDAVDRRRSALEDRQSGDAIDGHAGDTERLRVAVRRYRDFLDHFLDR